MSFSLRLLAAVLLIGAFGPGVTAAQPGGIFVAWGPREGPAPLDVSVLVSGHASGQNYNYICGTVEWDDGSESDEQCDFCLFCDPGKVHASLSATFEHTYVCPGTYTAVVAGDAGTCDCTYTYQITVTAPKMNLVAMCGASDTSCRLYAASAIDTEHLARAVVDWGDGTEPEEFTWTQESAWYAAPAHVYAEAGRYAVRVDNHIEGESCGWVQTARINVNPGYTTPVEQTTWGRVKALFREAK
jgi:hypothetical protein